MRSRPDSQSYPDRNLTQNDLLQYIAHLENEIYQTRELVLTMGNILSEQLNRIEDALDYE